MTPVEAIRYIAACRDSHVDCWTSADVDAPPAALGSPEFHAEVYRDYDAVLAALAPLVEGAH